MNLRLLYMRIDDGYQHGVVLLTVGPADHTKNYFSPAGLLAHGVCFRRLMSQTALIIGASTSAQPRRQVPPYGPFKGCAQRASIVAPLERASTQIPLPEARNRVLLVALTARCCERMTSPSPRDRLLSAPLRCRRHEMTELAHHAHFMPQIAVLSTLYCVCYGVYSNSAIPKLLLINIQSQNRTVRALISSLSRHAGPESSRHSSPADLLGSLLMLTHGGGGSLSLPE